MARAGEEPIVFVVSYHNLDYAAVGCERLRQMEPDAAKTVRNLANSPYGVEPADWVKDVMAGATECKSVSDPRELGRRLENELTDALAVNTRCAGVTVIRDPHPKFDGSFSQTISNIKNQKPYWDLMLDYTPGQKIFGWTLFPKKPGGDSAGALVNGEGVTSEVADAICIVVTGRGANIR